MAKKKRKRDNKAKKRKTNSSSLQKPREQKYPLLTARVKRRIVMVVMFVSGLLVSLSFFDQAGSGGNLLFKALNFLIGKTVFFIPLFLIVGGLLFYKPQKKRIFAPVFGSLALLALAVSGLFEALGSVNKTGNLIGYFISWPFLKFFGVLASAVVFSSLILISLLILWEFAPKRPRSEAGEGTAEKQRGLSLPKQAKEKIYSVPTPSPPRFEVKKIETAGEKKEKSEFEKRDKAGNAKDSDSGFLAKIKAEYRFPPLEIFSSSNRKPASGDIEYSSMIIKKTLANFGIVVEMGEVNVGPTVTQYTLKPAEGIKLSKITGLSNNLALALAARSIRIEAPIPGRSLVGIEVPNKSKAPVFVRELISSPIFQESPSPLFIPLGKDVSGKPVFADLEKMPHLLVAGSTGSGKTVFLQNLIVSLIFRNSPRILRLILVDPKRVEFPIYSALPHLLTPVICDAQKTVNVLGWLISEMERRFEVLSAVKARNIGSFNALLSKNRKLKEEYGILPYIVVIIDELADLMAARGREVESGIVRLSQLARAVGIHLVVATQRPSVNVITGLIKANLTSRIAFQVASHVDSRTVLDMAGAETLLGSGDMLYLSSEHGKPRRIQGCYVPQKDVKRLVEFLKKENGLEPEQEGEYKLEQKLSESLARNSETVSSGLESDDDPLYREAKKVVLEYKRASASLLQRRLKIGYARAARLLDALEDRGIVGPADGAKPREVYEARETDYNKTSE